MVVSGMDKTEQKIEMHTATQTYPTDIMNERNLTKEHMLHDSMYTKFYSRRRQDTNQF